MKKGLKLWSDNDHYVSEAADMYSRNIFDYIELYCVPDTYEKYIQVWKDLKIPYIIHTAHSSHGLNMADEAKKLLNLDLFEQSRMFADGLNAQYIIVHPGVLGSHKVVKKQLKLLRDKRILIENKPYLALNNKDICAGNDPQELREYMDSTGFGFCLDINHAFNAAKHKKIDYLEFIRSFTELKPSIVHICGIGSQFEVDTHIHLWEGDISLHSLVDEIRKAEPEYWTLETPKDSRTDLKDFVTDISFFNDLFKEQI